MPAAELAAKFRITGVLDFADSPGGLTKAVVSLGGMTGELYLQGAQVTAWAPAGARPVIYTSPNTALTPGRAIRGGIPIIFPWFGPNGKFPEAPQHGFARAAAWRLDQATQDGGAVTLQLSLAGQGDPFWPEPYRATFDVTFGTNLAVRLAVQNPSHQAIEFEEALHTYFAVSDVTAVSVTGLLGREFIDKVEAMRRTREAATALALTGETDRVYLDTPERLEIVDPGWQRRIAIDREGAASTIVWNPWAEKSAAMADLGADMWRGMICVETGNVADNQVRLAANSEHAMTTEIALAAGA